MTKRKTQFRLGTRLAVACLFGIAFIGFTVGSLINSSKDVAPTGRTAPGVNVDTQDLQRVVLQSHRGLTTNWGSFAASQRVVFFGYTFCPDICPIGLSNVAGAIDILDERGTRLRPIFITVDPKRDTPEVLDDYVTAFHERFEGLTGKEERIRTLASAFLAYFEVNADTKGDEYYLVDHTSFVYLVGETGELLGYYPESNSPEELASAILSDLNLNRRN